MRRSGVLNAAAAVLAACLVLVPAAAGAKPFLPPFKDRLFAYPGILSSADHGDYLVIDYREMRDINGRDTIPERRVKREYVSLWPLRSQHDLVIDTPVGKVRTMSVGARKGARFITLYLHGQGGSRKQGMNDWTFGGNFNRIKNLMSRNGGLYLTPDFTDFGDEGEAEVKGVIEHFAAQSPGAPVFVACGSMGGFICWKLAEDRTVAGKLSGLLLLGSMWDEKFLHSPAFRRRVPVFFGQGSHDTVFPIRRQEAFFRQIRAAAPGYPTRFRRFETGTHGTPIRMSNWRDALNWMLRNPPR
jgi:pimeloyl-ACP methyl ester carboxylesterase